jgi:hypothetical protein
LPGRVIFSAFSLVLQGIEPDNDCVSHGSSTTDLHRASEAQDSNVDDLPRAILALRAIGETKL